MRVAANYIDDDSRHCTGVFQAAYDLIYSGDLTRDELRPLRRAVRWFEQNLHAPEWLLTPRAIFWFRSDATECIANVWELVSLLRSHGRHLRLIVTRSPGSIVYQDEHQIAAVPKQRF